MKKIAVIVMAILAVQMVSAQQKNKGKWGKDLTAEEVANLKTKKMTLALDLTETQQNKVYNLNLENAKLRKAHMEERKAKKESGEANKPSKEERLAMMNKMLDHKIAIKAEMKDILNDEQYAKWEKMLAKRQSKMKKKHAYKKA
ncbi:hypothetical protein MHTCC0001_29490 [Flavobacteriaceae bacterium MHTCC 0001]